MTKQEIRTIFINIANGVGKHGSFLTLFAKTMLQADHENFDILLPVAEDIINKYNLNTEEYLANFD